MVIRDLLERLVKPIGVAGYEENFYKEVTPILQDIRFNISRDASGNLIATRKGPGRPIALIAHADTVGLIISHVSGNMARFQSIGGVDRRALPAHRVRIWRFAKKDEVYGVIGFPPPHLLKGEKVDHEDLFIDVEEEVSPGDIAVFDETPIIQGDRIMSPYLDDRLGCLVAIEVAKETDNNLQIIFTRGEEVGLQGAWRTMLDSERERLNIIIDTSAAGDHPPVPPGKSTSSLGKGPIIRIHDARYNMPLELRQWCEKIANELELPYQIGVVGGTTDAYVVALGTRNTIPVCISSRYSHSPMEMSSLKDVAGAIKLISAFVERW